MMRLNAWLCVSLLAEFIKSHFLQTETVIIYQELHLPTIPKVIHRIAATMGCGMAARIPPNFPASRN
jgi:hypothetical protein